MLVSVLLLTGCGKIVVVPLQSSASAPVVADGIIYALPKTVVRVQLKVDKTTRQGAPFAPYAAIFAPDFTPVCDDQNCTKNGGTEYSVEDGVTFSTYGEPDPNHVFVVKYAGGGAVDQSLTMTWNDTGLLSTANATVTNRTTDIVASPQLAL